MDFDNIKRISRKVLLGTEKVLLTPLSWGYGAGVWLRNTAFNIGLLKEEAFEVPVVSIGNVTVGGTGKTPHVEYIISRLGRRYNIAVLSRGYKRRTKGFVMASDNLTPVDLGDEPYQIYHKFRGLIDVAVCENRCKGIEALLKVNPDIDLILLDDALQHRYVKPKVNVVMIDYNRPPFDDKLLPLGQLREPADRILKCDMVVVTKCPDDIKPVDLRMFKEHLELFKYQQLYFSKIRYGAPEPVFPIGNPELTSLNWLDKDDLLLGVAGIANPRPFTKYLRQFGTRLKVIHYDDHHTYSRADFSYIFKMLKELEGRRKYIITTEKDAVRILNSPYFPPTRRDQIYFIPIQADFLNYEDRDFIYELQALISAHDFKINSAF